MVKVQVNKIATLTGHTNAVYKIEGGMDSKTILSADGDGRIVQWRLDDPENGEQLIKLPNSVYAMCLDRAKGNLIVGQNFEGIHIINLETRKELNSLKLTESYIFDIKTIGKIAIVACGDGQVLIIDLHSLTIIKRLKRSEKSARCIAIDAEGEEFSVGYSDNYIRIFNMADFQLIREFEAHKISVFTLKYIPGTQLLLSGSRDAQLKFWDRSNNYTLFEQIAAHMYTINDLYFSPNGKHFVTCSMDKSIKVWDSEKRKLIKVIDKARHAGHGTSIIAYCGQHIIILLYLQVMIEHYPFGR